MRVVKTGDGIQQFSLSGLLIRPEVAAGDEDGRPDQRRAGDGSQCLIRV